MSFLGGTRTGQTVTPRNILLSTKNVLELPGPNVIDGTNSYDGGNTYTWELRAGWVMAMITATRKWVPCQRTTVAGGGSGSGSGAGSAIVQVTNANAFQVGQSITIESTNQGTVSRTITAIDHTNHQITVNGSVLQYNTGSKVYANPGGSLAGAEIPRGVLRETVHLRNLEDITNTTLYDKAGVIIVQGYVDVNYMLGDYAACRDATVNYLGGILWGDRQQLNT